MTYTITKDYLPIRSERRSGVKNLGVRFIVAHDVGVIDSDADNNVRYYKNSAHTQQASAHTFIDDVQIIECIPLDEKAWHVIYNKPKDNQLFGDDANDIAIGVEMCYFSDKARTLASYKRYVWYLARLCKMYKLNPKTHIVGHHILDPGRKTDPVNALKTIGKSYNDLLQDVADEMEGKKVAIDKEKNAKADATFAESQKWVKELKLSDGTYPRRTLTRQEQWLMMFRLYQELKK